MDAFRTTVERSVSAAEAARACLDGLQALAPTSRPSKTHPVVHRAAQALQALGKGATVDESCAREETTGLNRS
jgi:hypothetical protein